MLGSNLCVWNDKTGPVNDNGTSDVELFDRIYHIMPTFGAKLWGDIKDYSLNELNELSAKTNYAPNSNPRYLVESVGDTYLDYSFNSEAGLDASGNKYNLEDQKMEALALWRAVITLVICVLAGVVCICLYNSRIQNTMFKGISLVYLFGALMPVLILAFAFLDGTVKKQVLNGLAFLIVLWVIDYVRICRGSKAMNRENMFQNRVLLLDADKEIKTAGELLLFVQDYARKNELEFSVEKDDMPLIVKPGEKSYLVESDADYAAFGVLEYWVRLTQV